MLGAQALRTKQKVDKKEKEKRKAAKENRQKLAALKMHSEDVDAGRNGVDVDSGKQQQHCHRERETNACGVARSNTTHARHRSCGVVSGGGGDETSTSSAHDGDGDDGEGPLSPRSQEYERTAKLVHQLRTKLRIGGGGGNGAASSTLAPPATADCDHRPLRSASSRKAKRDDHGRRLSGY